jgi:hypothetical protein
MGCTITARVAGHHLAQARIQLLGELPIAGRRSSIKVVGELASRGTDMHPGDRLSRE